MLLTVLLNAGIRQGFFYFFPRKTYFKSLFSATSLQRMKTEYSFRFVLQLVFWLLKIYAADQLF